MKNPLLQKYDVPAPRYTSYPTVPYWDDPAPGQTAWATALVNAFADGRSISLYIHLPYCERLCTYCGCNKRITKNHRVELPYIETVLKEWQLYLDTLPGKPLLREVHLGGGTPTFFSPENLAYLMKNIYNDVELADDFEAGFEAHPASTSSEHLQVLYDLGFRRLSIGVQDFDDDILRIINRLQTFEDVERVTQEARAMGYGSINYDLIFGLPFQTPRHIRDNMEKIKSLRPDRIAFYSYAHVPWIKPSQRAYLETDLPTGEEKRALYELGRELLELTGYREIGMDHFALPTDGLYRALADGSLHRNFMGYTPLYTRLSVALGASAISDTWDMFIQNEKTIETYTVAVEAGRFPIHRGHHLTDEDQVLRQHILNIMCRARTNWEKPDQQCGALYEGLERLADLEADGLVHVSPCQLDVTERGRSFLRNICMALDARYWKRQPEGRLFSQAV